LDGTRGEDGEESQVSAGQATEEVKQRKSLFTFEERWAFVHSFVDAYLRGTVTIIYWAGETDLRSLSTGEKAPGTDKVEMKRHFNQMLQIACENIIPKPSASEIENAIDNLFGLIVVFREGDFLKGEFLGAPDTELKIRELQDRVSSTEKLFDELIQRTKIRDP
jgi:hypothetical protein